MLALPDAATTTVSPLPARPGLTAWTVSVSSSAAVAPEVPSVTVMLPDVALVAVLYSTAVPVVPPVPPLVSVKPVKLPLRVKLEPIDVAAKAFCNVVMSLVEPVKADSEPVPSARVRVSVLPL